jgi:vanillate O-demethylase ferredoxin subunit
MLEVKVRAVVDEAVAVKCFELVDPFERELPPFDAGAHIDVMIPEAFLRQYSLCSNPEDRRRYLIGVLREETGRGGSKAMHDKVRPGHLITISRPRNTFALAEAAERYLLIAGGIGITPMMAMLETLKSRKANFTMHYCARSPERMAFKERLTEFVRRGRVIYHYDGGDPSRGLRPADVLGTWQDGTHLYYCGPAGLMGAIASAAAHWPAGTVHCEYFTPPPTSVPYVTGTTAELGGEFKIKIASTGAVLAVPGGRSIVDVLRGAGIECTTSCESGLCGTCRTRYLAGSPEHHDFVLTEAERGEYVMICCARSLSEMLMLDL